MSQKSFDIISILLTLSSNGIHTINMPYTYFMHRISYSLFRRIYNIFTLFSYRSTQQYSIYIYMNIPRRFAIYQFKNVFFIQSISSFGCIFGINNNIQPATIHEYCTRNIFISKKNNCSNAYTNTYTQEQTPNTKWQVASGKWMKAKEKKRKFICIPQLTHN